MMVSENLDKACSAEKHFHDIHYEPESSTSQPDLTRDDVEKCSTQTRPVLARKTTIPPLDWDDDDDPDNPFNWPLRRRMYNTMIPGLLGLAVTFGSSVYTPGYPEVAQEFGVSSTAALVPLSVWTLGLGFGIDHDTVGLGELSLS